MTKVGLRGIALSLLVLVLTSCAWLDYNAVGIHHSVVKGGTAEINAGNVVDVNGLPGIWLAGHRTTHGAVFHNLPNARVGDTVCVYSKCYKVTRIIHWHTKAAPGYLGRVVLQTSMPDGFLLVVCR